MLGGFGFRDSNTRACTEPQETEKGLLDHHVVCSYTSILGKIRIFIKYYLVADGLTAGPACLFVSKLNSSKCSRRPEERHAWNLSYLAGSSYGERDYLQLVTRLCWIAADVLETSNVRVIVMKAKTAFVIYIHIQIRIYINKSRQSGRQGSRGYCSDSVMSPSCWFNIRTCNQHRLYGSKNILSFRPCPPPPSLCSNLQYMGVI